MSDAEMNRLGQLGSKIQSGDRLSSEEKQEFRRLSGQYVHQESSKIGASQALLGVQATLAAAVAAIEAGVLTWKGVKEETKQDGQGETPNPASPDASPSESQKNVWDKTKGAKDTIPTKTTEDSQEWIYGPKDDPKINPDGSTKPNTWTSPDNFETQDKARDQLDPFKSPEGRRPANIPAGTEVQRGTTPGKEGPYQGQGGAKETLIKSGLPAKSVGEWQPLPKKDVDKK